MTILELRNQGAKFIADARKLVDRADEEKRELSTEEEEQYNRLLAEYDKTDKEVKKLEAQAKRRESLEKIEKDLETPQKPKSQIEVETPEKRPKFFNSPEYADVFNEWLLHGYKGMDVDQMSIIRKEYKAALQVDLDISGGYLVAPMQMVQQLLKAVDDMVFIRERATKFQVSMAQSLGVPSLDADPADADWTSELGTGSEDSTMVLGARELHPHPVAKRIKISNKLLRMAVMDPEGLVRQRLQYKFAVTHEKAFLTGSGSGQPLGIFTASAQGISTGRDVSTGNTTTSIAFDGLHEAKYTLKGNYWPRAAWLFHRDALKQIAKLKDGIGEYIWRENVRVGEPPSLLGLPYMMSEYVPKVFTTGKYVGCLGDYSYYWIADAMDMQVQLLKELYAETNQTGLIGRMESDGMPVLEEAFIRVKLA